MSRARQTSELQRCMRELLRSPRNGQADFVSMRTRSLVCGSLVALALSPGAATAVTLGELTASSRLGQPLKAAIPLRLAAGETINNQCISSAGGGRDLQGPAGLQFSVPAAQGPGNYLLGVSSTRPLVEPMYEISVRLDCQGTPRVIRHYVLMLDLPGMAPVLQPRDSQAPGANVGGDRLTTAVRSNAGATRSRGGLQRSSDPILPGSAYRVRSGDTLSTIAARIQGRPANSTWQLAGQIFSANPAAFIRNNPDLIKLGSEILIPNASSFSAVDPSTTVTSPADLSSNAVSSEQANPAPGIERRVSSTEQSTTAALPDLAEPTPATESAPDIENTAAQAGNMTLNQAIESPAEQEIPAETSSPFVAQPEAVVASEPAVAVDEPQPSALPAAVSISEAQPASVSPWLAVLLGVVLGVMLSLILIRSRLLEHTSALLRRPQRGSAAAVPNDVFIDTDEWLDPRDTEVSSVPVRDAAEETYVVEVAAAEASAENLQDSTENVFNPDPEPLAERTAAEEMPAMDSDELGEASEEFSDVFDDAMHGVAAETDLPLPEFTEEPSPTVEQPGFNTAATVEQPGVATAATVEQPAVAATEELPHLNSAGFAYDEDAATAELASLDDDSGETAEMTLDALETIGGDETRLSSTLQEALSLLEQDYEHELTASQVIDQQAIEDALADDEAAELQRKLTG